MEDEIREESAGPAWGKMLVGIFLVLGIGTFFLGVEREPRTETLGGASAPEERLRAGPFRETIEKLEWILYAEASEGDSDARELVALADKLAKDIREWESRLHMTVFINDIRDFGEFVRENSTDGSDDRALARLAFR